MRRWAFIVWLSLTAMVCTGQDPQFSRFYSNALYMAPSFAGSTGQNRLALSYRNQWPSIETGYQTYTASFDHYFEKLHSGVGLLFLNDIAGTGNLTTTNISLLYNYDFKIKNRIHIRPGMAFSLAQRSIDFNRLVWRDQMSAIGNAPSSGEVVSYENVNDLDFSVSGLVYSDLFWLGLSIDHLLHPNQSLYDQEYEEGNSALLPTKVQAFGGCQIILKEELLRPKPTSMQLAFLYKNQAGFNQLDMGFYWNRAPLVLGIWYRGIPFFNEIANNDALVLLIGFQSKQYNLGYSYDFTTSNLMVSSGGSHELSFSYTFGKPSKKRRPKKMVPCPDF
ncbi:MAG: PorP/SprF family type IX secretion system membrane protein [Bacteroidales bacterium]|nr:PorP/SprF family type IX secretion system membrane protein [Bacteroidales bacterium]